VGKSESLLAEIKQLWHSTSNKNNLCGVVKALSNM
jgi:hypothetical protein